MPGSGPSGDRGTKFDDITDGGSNTIIFAEQSAWLFNDDSVNQVKVDCRADGNHGFNMGGVRTASNRWFNLITVRYPVNELVVSRMPGAEGNVGPNRPIHSAHPGGAHVSLCDGSTHFLTEEVNLVPLFNLCDKDDGQIATIDQ